MEDDLKSRWVLKPVDSLTTSKSSTVLKWPQLMLHIALDKRHDLETGLIEFWMLKLRNYPDEVISEALATGRWGCFPSVDEVLDQIEHLQACRRQENANRDHEQYLAEQKRAEKEGLLATEEQYAAVREAWKKLGTHSFPQPERKPPPPPEMTDAELRDRREMLRQQTEQILKQRGQEAAGK